MDMAPIIMLIITIVQGYTFLMFIWVLLSWVPDLKYTKFYRLLDRIFIPYLEPFRRIIPPINSIDISPMIGFFVLQFITTLLGKLL